MKRERINEKTIKNTPPPARGEAVIWDVEVAGLGLRVRAGGGKTWMLKRGKRRFHLGSALDRKIPEVRSEALGLLAEIASGREPSRKSRTRKPTVETVLEVYLDDHVRPRRRASTVANYRRLIDNHIAPRLGKIRADDLTPRDIDRMMTDMKDTPTAANRCLALLNAAFQKAMRWGLRSPALGNPCTGADRHEVESHEEYLEADEMRILLECVAEIGRQPGRWHAAQCIRLLALTGCRRDEIRALLWDGVDFEKRRLDWEMTKTGRGHLMLHQAAIDVLREVQEHDRRRPTKHVFQGENRHVVLPRATLYRAWADIKTLAIERGLDAKRIKRLRPHDLRHSFATLGLSHGLTLEDVGRLLRHRDTRSTKRYARHLPSREAALAQEAQVFLPV